MEEKVSNINIKTRELNLDLLKALAIFAMILCHCVIRLAAYIEGYENSFWYFFADVILGDYAFVAHGFMLSMGVCIIFSRNQEPTYLIKRGICIFILAYILNFFRYGIYVLIDGIIEGEFVEEVLDAFFCQDIFHFAGLALIVTGLLRLLKLKSIHILLIGIALSIIGSPLALVVNSNWVVNYFVGFLFFTPEACLTFFNWYIFVGVGLVFGEVLKKTSNKDKFYKNLLIYSSIVAVVYITLTSIFGAMFLSKEHIYYACSILESIGLLSIDFTFLSIFYFLLKKKDQSRDYWYTKISKNTTIIYIIQWCIIGLIESVVVFLLGIVFPYWLTYVIGVILIVVSIVLADLFKKLKERKRLNIK